MVFPEESLRTLGMLGFNRDVISQLSKGAFKIQTLEKFIINGLK